MSDSMIVLIATGAVLGWAVLFGVIWIGVTSILTGRAGWRALARAYPDIDAPVLLRLGGQSGVMGPDVRLNRVLSLTATANGLRIAMWRPMAPFAKPFHAPWNAIRTDSDTAPPIRISGGPWTRLTFGDPALGTLVVSSRTWRALSAARDGS